MATRPPCREEYVAAGYSADTYEHRFTNDPEVDWGPCWSDPNWKKSMSITYINPGDYPVTVRLGKKSYTINPGEEFTPPDKFAYAIPLMGVKLVTVEEFLSPTQLQKRKQEAVKLQELADKKHFEAKELAKMASHADADAATNADQIAELARLKREEATAAQETASKANLDVILAETAPEETAVVATVVPPAEDVASSETAKPAEGPGVAKVQSKPQNQPSKSGK